jgi:invasion protein IalB
MAISSAAYSDDQPLTPTMQYRTLLACTKFFSLLSQSASDAEQKDVLNRQSRMYLARAITQSAEIDTEKHPSWIYICQSQAENDVRKLKQSLESAPQDEVGSIIKKFSDNCSAILARDATKAGKE